ncbi:MAG: regulator [Paraprevotella sp.]|nr:regulator [Paraprevotella sp.]
MRKYILLLVTLMYTQFMIGQAIGSWKTYPALQIATYNVPVDDKVYSLCNGNLFSYNTSDTEVYVYDRLNGLHDTKIKFIRYCHDTDKLVLVYENGNVDLIYPNDEVTNLKQLKEKNYPNLIINNLSIVGKTAFISTNFGVLSIDTEYEEFESTYDLNLDVLSCIKDEENIYISSKNGCYKGDINQNLLDKNNWTYLNNSVYNELAFFNNELIGFIQKKGVYKLDKNTLKASDLQKGNFTYFSCEGNVMITGNNQKTYLFKSITEREEINQDNHFNYIVHHKNTYWASQNIKGLQPYTLQEKLFVATSSAIQPNSPVRDYFCQMHYVGNRLLIAGGDLNYSGIVRDGTVMYYENDTWYNFSEENIAEQTKLKYVNVTSIAQDPKDSNHHYVSSARHGMYEFNNLTFTNQYDYTNSLIDSIAIGARNPRDYVNCMGLQYDDAGNLWMVNGQVDTLIVIMTPDKTWHRLYYPEIKMAPTCPQILFDQRGRMWMNSQRLSWAGIFCLDYNGTIEDNDDDTYIIRKSITNQDGLSYSPYQYNCMAEDHDGQIWIGTDIGPFVISSSDDFFSDNFTYTQVKIPRNDGTDYADYLLSGVSINCIAVDAANRKWIGTSSNGIYLISADGQEMLQHFTTENSPLISDEILSIAVNPQTGEVMIGTFDGLMSYMSDANTPSDELDKDNVRVYPNPVKPDYNGLITIDGLTMNAEVKIATITGQVIYSGHSNGGLFTWNGKDQTGRRVSSGVYNIISTNSEGKKAIVNKITFIH